MTAPIAARGGKASSYLTITVLIANFEESRNPEGCGGRVAMASSFENWLVPRETVLAGSLAPRRRRDPAHVNPQDWVLNAQSLHITTAGIMIFITVLISFHSGS
jgi:hypothetical protein